MIGCLRIVLSPKRFRVRPEGDTLGLFIHLDLACVPVLALTQHKVTEDKKAARLALNRDFPLHRGILSGCASVNGDGAAIGAIDPAAIAEAHLEHGWQGKKPPIARNFREDAQAACPHDIESVARDGKELVQRVAAQLRGEYAMHPARHGKRVLIRQKALPGSKDGAVPAFHEPVFIAEYRVPVQRAVFHEIGEELPIPPFLMPSGLVQLPRSAVADERRRVLHNAPCGRRERHIDRSERTQRRPSGFDLR